MTANGTRLLGPAGGAVASAFVAHVPALAVLAVFALAYLLLLDQEHLRLQAGIVGLFVNLIPVFRTVLIGGVVIGLIALTVMHQRRRLLARAARRLATLNWAAILLLRVPLALVLVVAVSYFYLSFKINIPYLNPYSWDHFFARLDRLLFLGQDPWVLSHRLLPSILASQVFNVVYILWFFMMNAAVFGVAVLPARHPLRLTFLTAYALNWLVAGTLLAILFPAAGPVYLERLTGDPTFAPLMERLYAQSAIYDISTLRVQESLWRGYAEADATRYGISAFPSLHLAMAATCACLGFALSRALGWVLAAFTLAILIATVHLGWHYAVDGFAGIALAVAFWRIAEATSRWWLARTAARAVPKLGDGAVAAK